MQDREATLLVVGAGGAGLSAANFLIDLGVDALTIERRPTTAGLPKAHYLNQRSMEIFRHHGMADAIYAKATPRENLGKVFWHTSLGGDDELDGIVFAEQDAMGAGALEGLYDAKGVTPPSNLPQIRLEPLLADMANTKRPGSVVFNREFISLSQEGDRIRSVIRNHETNEDEVIYSRFVIGADGGRQIGPSLGVEMVGEKRLQDMVVNHVTADFSQYLHDDLSVMRMIIHPRQVSEVAGAQYFGALLALGPDRWDRHSEEWAVCWAYAPDDPARHDMDNVIPRIKEFLKVDVPIQVHKVSHWYLEAVIANQFQVGNVFLIGDAAHKHTPGGGLGLNSGIQDAHNLSWKIAQVVNGTAGPTLLDSYERERRPVVERNAEWSLFALLNHSILHSAMGLNYAAPAEVNERMFRKLLAETPDGVSRRARMNEIMQTARIEYAIPDMELGFTYPNGAIVDDGSPWPPRDPMGHIYTPGARPGCRLPHAWLHMADKVLSTHDLLPLGGWLILTGEHGWDWCAAAMRVSAETGLTIRAVRIGAKNSDAEDPSGAWAAASGIDSRGIVLVRPDGHVGFRSPQQSGDLLKVLGDAIAGILNSQ